MVTQSFKLLLSVPTSHIRVLVPVLVAPLITQLLVNIPEKMVQGPSSLPHTGDLNRVPGSQL